MTETDAPKRRKRRVWRWVLIGLAIVLVGIQFIPVDRTNPPVQADVTAPQQVKEVLRRSCYDCHSNESRWPWYSYVAPVSWLVASDVHEARQHLNFSTWNAYNANEQADKIGEVWEEVEAGEMPLWFYTPLHPDASLTDEDRAILQKWAGK